MTTDKHLSEQQVSDFVHDIKAKRLKPAHVLHANGCARCQKRVLFAFCLYETILEIPADEFVDCTDMEVMASLIEGATAKFAGIIAGA